VAAEGRETAAARVRPGGGGSVERIGWFKVLVRLIPCRTILGGSLAR
jgi:hypothetical protein